MERLCLFFHTYYSNQNVGLHSYGHFLSLFNIHINLFQWKILVFCIFFLFEPSIMKIEEEMFYHMDDYDFRSYGFIIFARFYFEFLQLLFHLLLNNDMCSQPKQLDLILRIKSDSYGNRCPNFNQKFLFVRVKDLNLVANNKNWFLEPWILFFYFNHIMSGNLLG